jgi:hypothetical protein
MDTNMAINEILQERAFHVSGLKTDLREKIENLFG